MRLWSVVFWFGIACSLLVTGCSPKLRGTACAVDDDCAGGEVCLGQECTPLSCDDDADCPGGQVCFDSGCGRPCSGDPDCPLGLVCDPREGTPGRCVECLDAIDCQGAADPECIAGLCYG